MRSSPTQHAANLTPGTRSKGNDGALYEVKEGKNGVRRWVRVPPSDRATQQEVTLILKPSIGVIDEDLDHIKNVSLASALKQSLITLSDIVGERARSVVLRATLTSLVKRIKALMFDMAKHHYVLTLVTSNAPGLCAEMKDQFGDLAGDGWMEDDIRITPLRELHLDFVSCR